MKQLNRAFCLYLCLMLGGCWDSSQPQQGKDDASQVENERHIHIDTIGTIVGRSDFGALANTDSTVMLVGGRIFQSQGWLATSTVTEFDVALGVERTLPSMHVSRAFFDCVMLHDGRVLVAGGIDSMNVVLASVEIYDPVQRAWTIVGEMSTPRWQFSSAMTSDSLWYLIGGRSTFDNSTHHVDVYDIKKQALRPGVELPLAVHNSSAIALDSCVFVLGGRTSGSNSERFGDLLKLSPKTPYWAKVGSYCHSVTLPTMKEVGGHILVSGGCRKEQPIVECCDSVFTWDGNEFRFVDSLGQGAVYDATTSWGTYHITAGGLHDNGTKDSVTLLQLRENGLTRIATAWLAPISRAELVMFPSDSTCAYLFGGQNQIKASSEQVLKLRWN